MIKGKTIILGVSGGIAAYKSADLASKLTQAGAMVNVIMTAAATKFVAPLTFRGVTGRPVITGMFAPVTDWNIEHVALADAADVVIVAPATADIIAKIAAGIADDMLTTTILSTRAPVVVAPAMDLNMFANRITQENISRLKARGLDIIEPASGHLASGKTGRGRLPETDVMIEAINRVLERKNDLQGKKIVVTAGGTREPIDPVRVITNRSSGKMGYALAEAARDRGAGVILVTAAALPDPADITVVKVQKAAEMQQAVSEAIKGADVLIMAAAVADYQPKTVSLNKIKKAGENLTLELVKTPDILGEIRGGLLKIGFAAESENLLANARQKLRKKKLDLIVANDITDGVFGSDTNRVFIIDRNGMVEDLPRQSKRDVAERVLQRVAEIMKKVK